MPFYFPTDFMVNFRLIGNNIKAENGV